jgi:aminoglycoside 2''-phosphotransferase
MSEQRARTEIARAFPELPVRDIAFLGAGMDSDAYLVDDEWVFRFPKREAAARALGREAAVLPKLAGRLPVATPTTTCCTSGRTTARPSFVGSSAIATTRSPHVSSGSSGSSMPATT